MRYPMLRFKDCVGTVHKSIMPLIVLVLFGIFVTVAIINTLSGSKQALTSVIQQNEKTIVEKLELIERTCKIINVEQTKNPINFLTVGSFDGSQVGPLNLKHPERWQGPYLSSNPTAQGKDFMLVRTKNGYFVVPGDGVRLPSGKIMGSDIQLDEHSDIAAMMTDGGLLYHNGMSLALPVTIKKRGGFFKGLLPQEASAPVSD